ncbi:hypothetical protein PQR39_35375 [Paraburkholderia sediminicola]|uniref:hypothetical protein n=1 Tax=Paraburkholderia sediminicola TaxID=458836 RepID=UPI0038BB8581
MPIHEDLPRYKDVAAAKGSELYEALESKNMALEEALYQRGEKEAKDLLTKYPARGQQ